MQDYNTIIGVLTMRHNQCSLGAIQDRHRIGSGTVQMRGGELSGIPYAAGPSGILPRMSDLPR